MGHFGHADAVRIAASCSWARPSYTGLHAATSIYAPTSINAPGMCCDLHGAIQMDSAFHAAGLAGQCGEQLVLELRHAMLFSTGGQQPYLQVHAAIGGRRRLGR